MPEEDSTASPSNSASDKSKLDAGKPPAFAKRSRNARRYAILWLVPGIIALGIALFLVFESGQWRDARDVFRDWLERLNPDWNFATLQPAPQESPQESPQNPLESVPAPVTSSPATSPETLIDTRETTRQQTTSTSSSTDATWLLEQRLTPVERQIEQLRSNDHQLRQRMDLLSQRQIGLENHIGMSSPYARQAALALGLLQLSIASANGTPFEAERLTLAGLLPNDADIAALQGMAKAGVASEASLLLEIPLLVDSIAASRKQSEGSGIWNWVRIWIVGLVQIRRLDVESAKGRDDILARMEKAARGSSLDDALAAALLLRGSDGELVVEWIGAARRRLELRMRIEALSQVVASVTTLQKQ